MPLCSACPALARLVLTDGPWAAGSVLAVALLHHHAGHALDAVGPVVFVVGLPRHVLQVLHVCAHQHVAQLDEVTVGLVLHCQDHGARERDRGSHESRNYTFTLTGKWVAA